MFKRRLYNNGNHSYVATANEHVPRIERRFRVIKKWIRAIIRFLPYVTMSKLIVVELMYFVVH